MKNRALIYGTHALMEAIDGGVHLDKILIDHHLKSKIGKDIRDRLRGQGVAISYVPKESLDRIVRGTHQGVIAFLSPIPFYDVQEIISKLYEEGTVPRIVILDHITDVRNFGAIARSAECFGFNALVISEKGSAAVNEEAVKASAGALMKIPVCKTASFLQTLELIRNNGFHVIGVSEHGQSDMKGLSHDGPLALILGNEETGISPMLLSRCHEVRRIGMSGSIQSLNVSVAAAIAMYELSDSGG